MNMYDFDKNKEKNVLLMKSGCSQLCNIIYVSSLEARESYKEMAGEQKVKAPLQGQTDLDFRPCSALTN